MTLTSKRSKGSQSRARTNEQRRKNLEAVKRYYARKKAGTAIEDETGPATIGKTLKLAPGATNPMWAIEYSVEAFAEHVAPFLKRTRPVRYKNVPQSAPGAGIWMKQVEIPDTEDDGPEQPEEPDIEKTK